MSSWVKTPNPASLFFSAHAQSLKKNKRSFRSMTEMYYFHVSEMNVLFFYFKITSCASGIKYNL